MDHRDGRELQDVPSEVQGGSILHQHGVGVDAVIALEKGHGLGVADELQAWVARPQLGDQPCVVGLHVVDDQIIQRTPAKDLLEFVKILV